MKNLSPIIFLLVIGCSDNSNGSSCNSVKDEIGDCLNKIKLIDGTKESAKVKEALQGLCEAYIEKAEKCVKGGK